jgi:hypothetical protein
MDILDVTLGTTFVLAENRLTIAAAVSFPTRDTDYRVYDWELQIQFNYYFGARSRRAEPTPPLSCLSKGRWRAGPCGPPPVNAFSDPGLV